MRSYLILILVVLFQCFNFAQNKEYFTFKEALKEPDSVKVLSLGDYKFDSKTNKIFKIDSRISLLKNLEELNFTCNYLDTLPIEITKLKHLKQVSIIDANNLSSTFNDFKLNFSDTFKKLSKIKNLNFLYIPFVKFNLPKAVKYLKNIKTLSLVENDLRSLPTEISQMKQLRFLDVRDNKLNTLPNSISQLDSLINLDLSDNRYDSIPSVVFSIVNLKYLNFSFNKIKNLPKDIDKLSGLKWLNLENNSIEQIPRELFNCKNLETLNISNNKISNIPIEILSLKKLKRLDISGNNIPEKQIEILKHFLKKVKFTK
jgi:leucine-rich repeat protein SHOC2